MRRGGAALVVVALATLAIGPAQPVLRQSPKQPAFWPPPVLSRERAIAETLRVDSRGGGVFDTGTGVGIGAHVVLTNAHLTRNPVTLVTRCGDDLLPVDRVVVAGDGTDVAVLVTSGASLLPVELAARDPEPGDRVLLAGYPQGELALTEGRIEGGDGQVLRFSPEPEVGQSGSPLLDGNGRIVGLAYADERIGGQGLAYPVSRLRGLLDEVRRQHVSIAEPVMGDPSAVVPRSSPCP